MTGLAKFVNSVRQVRAAIKAKKVAKDGLARDIPGSSSSLGLEQTVTLVTASPWKLPVEIQIHIFAYCGISDFLQLKLVCKAFYELLLAHEHSIVREYMRLRRHGSLPSPIDSERTYTRNPEDDVVLLSDLFPPAKSAKGGHLYTFRYLHGLRRRQTLCSHLCYYLADRIMDRFVQCEPAFVRASFPSRNERNALVQRGKVSVSFNLTPLMYYTLYFLESYTAARREHTNMLLRDFEAGRIPVPIPLSVRQSMYRDLQTHILRAPPFTDTPTLVATHHCMQLLVSYIRYTMSPEGGHDDSWISSLLTLAPFVRILEFFSAEIGHGGSQLRQRKNFMNNFDRDIKIHAKDDMNSVVFARASNAHMHSDVRDIWFDAAHAEMVARGAIPHNVEHVWVWNGVPILFGCQDCHFEEGWRA
ncbi:hypothetical protein N7510_002489 [Penicillium lagena]|uniref:uncharacterized protein n=1 Tax=Penicillium lagena TaxID=94218 RepID=UPI00253FFBE7|nr:uncharacterized protein N7510_002489 [Penicillium lagena]KAJ5626180.1 hypothetical protein N7510_002489 [Penicillium lagena]